MKLFLIIVASGKGSRLNEEYPKQFIKIAGKTILEHCLEPFLNLNKFSKIVVTIPPQKNENFIQTINNLKAKKIDLVEGGDERQDSVFNALLHMKSFANSNDFVFIHDGVRPLVNSELIKNLMNNIPENDGVIPIIPLTNTIKKTSTKKIVKTINRNNLFAAQTPQVFKFCKIYNLSLKAKDEDFHCTDDSSIFEHYGESVFTIPGSKLNIKITTPEDLELLKKIMSSYRTGYGYDVHKLSKNKPLVLLGEKINFDMGLIGHSDADVATHALIDALLGAAGIGDIGDHFPDTDTAYKNISSLELLKKTFLKIENMGFQIENIDITIVAEKPKITPFKCKMKKNIARALLTSEEKINVKAKTTEGLGFEGEGLGISAHAITTLKLA